MPTVLTRRRYVRNQGKGNIDLAGCVFYAPLWRPDMGGATFYSKDSSPKLCTVTGATWGSQGRTFDNTDDDITVSSFTAFTTESFSVGIWIKPNSVVVNRDIIHQYVSNTGGWRLAQVSAQAIFYLKVEDNYRYSGAGTLSTTAPTFVMFVKDGSTSLNAYINGALNNGNTAGSVLANIGSTTADLKIADANVYTHYGGLVGDTLIYNRAWSAGEISRLYQSTKWRYS